jgi:thiol:disulfide interchange protein
MPRRSPSMTVFALLAGVLALLPAAWAAAAQPTITAPHVTVTLLVPPAQLYPGQSFKAGLDFQMEKGWHVYWQNAGDSGEPPTATWKLPAGVTASAFEYPAPTRLPLGPLMDFGYENEVIFPVPMQVGANFRPMSPDATVGAHLTWLVCREVCIPGKGDVAVSRAALASPPASPQTDSAAHARIAAFEKKLPQPLPAGDAARFTTNAKGFVLDVSTGSPDSSAEFFPLDETVVANAAAQPVQSRPDGVQLTLTKDENIQGTPQTLNGVVELDNGAAYTVHATPGTLAATAPAAGSTTGLLGIAGLAFVGGMILNLMPCVFPVLFIKALALVQSGQQERHRLRAHGWVYTLGILVSFWAVVGVLLVLRAAGRQLGWGFQFQSPTFLALMAMLLFFVGLALAGQFEIGLSLTSAGGSLAEKHGYAGSFFTGVLAMVVATPCTAPFMGAAVGYALAHSALVSFVIFTAVALGLAAPYVVLAYFPAWARLLPRPGAWMEVLKQAVAIPIFGTVIWLVWVFTQLAGTAALMGLLAAFLLLAIAGWFLGHWPGKARAAYAGSLIVILAIASSVWTIRAFGVVHGRSMVVGSVQENGTSPPATWQPFTPAALADARAQGHPVFVDFTASWCLSCQVNERLILDRGDVEQRLRDSGATLLRADWTNQDPVITQALASLGRSGVPTYVIYPADPSAPPHVLPEVLTRGMVMDALDSLPKSGRQSASLSRPISQ